MNCLLGNYLSLGDLIIVHMCGGSRNLCLKKGQEYLGLTITDNGIGRAFVKKVRSNDKLIEDMIKPGDHIAAINSESMIGLRHHEVAKALREIPQGAEFTLHLVQPLSSAQQLEEEHKVRENPALASIDRLNSNSPDHFKPGLEKYEVTLLSNKSEAENMESLYDDLANSSLPIDQLLSRSANVDSKGTDHSVRNDRAYDSYRRTIESINSILESFLGINDNALAVQIYRLAKENKDSQSSFSKAMRKSELNILSFDEEIETHLWNCISDTDHRCSTDFKTRKD